MICTQCDKSTGIINLYIVGGNLVEPAPYHKECVDVVMTNVLNKLFDYANRN